MKHLANVEQSSNATPPPSSSLIRCPYPFDVACSPSKDPAGQLTLTLCSREGPRQNNTRQTGKRWYEVRKRIQ